MSIVLEAGTGQAALGKVEGVVTLEEIPGTVLGGEPRVPLDGKERVQVTLGGVGGWSLAQSGKLPQGSDSLLTLAVSSKYHEKQLLYFVFYD